MLVKNVPTSIALTTFFSICLLFQKGKTTFDKISVDPPDMTTFSSEQIYSALIGVAIGDALGVPYEFSTRTKMQAFPATDMIGYGSHQQPPGTWSDDSSMTFCLAEALANETFSLKVLSTYFLQWESEGFWTARGEVFDIGITTAESLTELRGILRSGKEEALSHLRWHAQEFDNGNGSLMRILPLLFYLQGKPIHEQFEITWQVSALTHKHVRAAMSCLIYLKLGEYLLQGQDKSTAYSSMKKDILDFWNQMDFPSTERVVFSRLIAHDIRNIPETELKSGGYVIEVLESSIYFFIMRDRYQDIVLSIINLGHDTDTSAAIAGGLAGLYYTAENIPSSWINAVARQSDIHNLATRMHHRLQQVEK